MAVETEGSHLGASGRDVRRRSLSVLGTCSRAIRDAAQDLAAQLGDAADGLRKLSPLPLRGRWVREAAHDAAHDLHDLAAALAKGLADPRALLPRPRLREFIVSGPLVRFLTRTLQRRIILPHTLCPTLLPPPHFSPS